jgi:hypothetical protein
VSSSALILGSYGHFNFKNDRDFVGVEHLANFKRRRNKRFKGFQEH